jgi:hypothetical protein
VEAVVAWAILLLHKVQVVLVEAELEAVLLLAQLVALTEH